MSVLSIGQPKIEIAKLDKNDNIGEWIVIDVPKDGTTTLETSEGDRTEYLQEGGGKVDVDIKESGYTLTFDLFVKKNFVKPIASKNGVIIDNYAVRVTPKDPEAKGIIIYKAMVSCLDSYSVADGLIAQYKFDALQTDDHENMMDYYVDATNLKTDVNFVNVAAAGGTAEVTAEVGGGDTLTAECSAEWFSAETGENGKVTVTATKNEEGERREGWLTIKTDDGCFAEVRVNQPKG